MQVSGLATGLDTASIITKLMSVERQSGKGLTTSQTKAQTLLAAFQKVNNLATGMSSAAKALVPDPIMKTSAWTSSTATSSNTSIATVSTTGRATPGSLQLTVEELAAAGSAVSAGSFDLTTALNGGAGFSFDVVEKAGTAGETRTTVNLGANSKLSDVVSQINTTATGVQATLVNVGNDQYRIQLTSKASGAGTNVSIGGVGGGTSAVVGGFNTLTAASDAQMRVGSGAGSFTVTSTTNTFKDLLPGLNVTAVKKDPATPLTVDIKADVSGISGKITAMLDAANQVLDNIRSNSKFDSATKSAGTLLGQSATQELSTRIARAAMGTSADALGAVGISVSREGGITFDTGKFAAAYAADPNKVEAAVTQLAKNLDNVGKQATNPTDGYLSSRIKGEQSLVSDYTKQIAKFEERMTSRQKALEHQFASLETMLSKLQSQGNWLAGQLKTLPSSMG